VDGEELSTVTKWRELVKGPMVRSWHLGWGWGEGCRMRGGIKMLYAS